MVDTLSVNPVDEVLRQARQLLGTMAPVALTPFTAAAPAAPASWDSESAAAAAVTQAGLADQLGGLHDARLAVQTAIEDADAVIRAAHTRLNALENAWAGDREAAAAQDSDESQAGLLTAAHTHVREVTEVVQHTAEHFQTAAARVAAVAATLP
jgi:hypothetical protein